MILDNSTLQTLVPGPPCVPTLYPVHCGVYLPVLCADLLCGEVRERQPPHQILPVIDDHLPNCHRPDWLPVLQPLAISSSSTYNVWVSPPLFTPRSLIWCLSLPLPNPVQGPNQPANQNDNPGLGQQSPAANLLPLSQSGYSTYGPAPKRWTLTDQIPQEIGCTQPGGLARDQIADQL
ncbi:hypothetical protein DSO57_1013844 [Entomophthora muscae]|uniref:Uncharacterized protein n=1 Tax=Entomophthora muscae TaxID=34485 RepID=A0ACC2T617_9FUNG|nr:hypothetical protein DSO57_1013844 [Entomophthora muscae]